MPTGATYVRSERRRLINLIEGADLWSHRILADGSGGTETASAAGDRPAALREFQGPGRLRDALGYDSHRCVEVFPLSFRPLDVSPYSNSVQDVAVAWAVVMCWVGGGGNAMAGMKWQLSEVAIQDAERVRQELEHPENRTAGTTGRYTVAASAIQCIRVDVGLVRFDFLDDADTDDHRCIASLDVTSQLRVTTEVA